MQLHRILPIKAGGEDKEENLLCLCPNCHIKIHCGDIDKTREDLYLINRKILNKERKNDERNDCWIFGIVGSGGGSVPCGVVRSLVCFHSAGMGAVGNKSFCRGGHILGVYQVGRVRERMREWENEMLIKQIKRRMRPKNNSSESNKKQPPRPYGSPP